MSDQALESRRTTTMRASFTLLASVFLFYSPVQATPIEYRLSGTGSGSVNGESFTDQPFTYTFLGDTQNVSTWYVPVGGPANVNTTELSPTTLQIGAFAPAQVISDGFVFSNTVVPNPVVGFALDGINDMFDLASHQFSGYGLTTSLETVVAPVLQGGFQAIQTSLGEVQFSSYGSHGSFTAQVVPAPASVWLLGTALGVVGWIRRKHPG